MTADCSVSEPVWRWQKRVPTDEQSLERWESLIEEGFVPNGTIQQAAGAKTASVEVFTTDADHANDLKLAFGGRAEIIDAAALMAPSPDNGPPLLIRNQLVVSESTDEVVLENLREQYPQRDILSFPPELAFGTGRHGTTGTCLRLLADISRQRCRQGEPWHMLDVGHGTGILAVAAAVLGAESALGFDNDAFAVEAGRRNAQRHGLDAERCHFDVADLAQWRAPGGRRYEVVAANLFAGLLVEYLGSISGWMAEGGDLVVSGILRHQADEVIAAGNQAGLHFDAPCRSGKWVAMRGRHRS